MIPIAFEDQKHRREHDRHKFRYDDRDPNAVDLPKQGQNQDRRHLKYHRSQKRNDGRGHAVIERGEEARSENRVSHKQERKRENTEARDCQLHQLRVVAHENAGKRRCQKDTRNHHNNSENGHHKKTFSKQTF